MAGKYDDQQQYKAIIEAAMVSIPEVFTHNIPISFGPYLPAKQPNTRKYLCKFSETLDAKPKTDFFWLCVSTSKSKAIREDNILLSIIPKLHGHTKKWMC